MENLEKTKITYDYGDKNEDGTPAIATCYVNGWEIEDALFDLFMAECKVLTIDDEPYLADMTAEDRAAYLESMKG